MAFAIAFSWIIMAFCHCILGRDGSSWLSPLHSHSCCILIHVAFLFMLHFISLTLHLIIPLDNIIPTPTRPGIPPANALYLPLAHIPPSHRPPSPRHHLAGKLAHVPLLRWTHAAVLSDRDHGAFCEAFCEIGARGEVSFGCGLCGCVGLVHGVVLHCSFPK